MSGLSLVFLGLALLLPVVAALFFFIAGNVASLGLLGVGLLGAATVVLAGLGLMGIFAGIKVGQLTQAPKALKESYSTVVSEEVIGASDSLKLSSIQPISSEDTHSSSLLSVEEVEQNESPRLRH